MDFFSAKQVLDLFGSNCVWIGKRNVVLEYCATELFGEDAVKYVKSINAGEYWNVIAADGEYLCYLTLDGFSAAAEFCNVKQYLRMQDVSGKISRFIEDTRDTDGAQSFVWLSDRGVMVHLDTCTDLALVSAAAEQLAAEQDETAAKLAKVRRWMQELEG